jgi:hypothetical protein
MTKQQLCYNENVSIESRVFAGRGRTGAVRYDRVNTKVSF